VNPAVDAAAAEGLLDPERLAVLGLSQGSWSGLALLAQTNRFKCGIVGFGLTKCSIRATLRLSV
jgi:dipeptidyl aminopeptidase/acylaminoacyl peptidase